MTRSSGAVRRDAANLDPALMTRRGEHHKLEADYLASLERLAARPGLKVRQRKSGRAVLAGPDEKDIQPWRESYPYRQLLRRKAMRYVLSLFDYPGRRDEVVGLADPMIVGSPEMAAHVAVPFTPGRRFRR